MAISLSGLDLPWLDAASMGRGRFRYDEERGVIPVQECSGIERDGAAYVLPDLDRIYGEDNFISVIDDTKITSRSQLREHNKRHGVIQTGDVRGEQLRDKTKEYMRHNPDLRNSAEFSWKTPRGSGNLGEI
jgi:hypothetical protein